jgi:MULE transposase domain
MPLLDILGVDGLDQGFTVGVSFMNAETEEGYSWAITHLRSLFQPGIWPSVIATDCDEGLMHAVESSFPVVHTKMVLCYWHVSKNVVANCKKFFETEEAWEPFLKGFRDCVFAKTEEEFEDIVKEWQNDFYWNDGMPWQVGVNSTPQEVQEMVEKEMAQSALTYCLGRWLGTYKMQLVHCYVDQHFHAGTTTTSRLEGAHHVLKSWIGGPSKNLTAVWEAVQLAIDHQLDEIQAKRAYSRASSLLRTGNEFFAPLQRRITTTAQVKVAEQWQVAQTEEARVRNGDVSSICTGNYSRSMGIPCWHTIKARLEEGGRLQPQDFHPHWHWEKPLPGSAPIVLPPPILDPETRQRRRTEEAARRLQARQHARVRTAHTGRILSQFEQQQPVLRHCSACIEYGHDKATCRGCRSTTHTRNACPNVSYQRRIATDPQLNIEGETSFQQQPQQPPTTQHPFAVPRPRSPITIAMRFPTYPGPLQVPTCLPPIYPPPTQTQLPQSHAWNGPHNPHYWQ